MKSDDIITVEPVEHTSNAAKDIPDQSKYFTYGEAGQAARTTYAAPTETQAPKQPSRLTGVAQIVGGGAVALVGIPMLILPGPGLLAIGGGAVLMARGAKNLIGKKQP